jgi:hypothetical protein
VQQTQLNQPAAGRRETVSSGGRRWRLAVEGGRGRRQKTRSVLVRDIGKREREREQGRGTVK